MGADPELLNNDIRDSTDFGAARGQAADNLAEPARDGGRRRTLAPCCACRFVCGKIADRRGTTLAGCD